MFHLEMIDQHQNLLLISLLLFSLFYQEHYLITQVCKNPLMLSDNRFFSDLYLVRLDKQDTLSSKKLGIRK